MTANLFASIIVGGQDARVFLQGQLTCDIDKLSPTNSLLACVNSAQGRVQAVLEVHERQNGIELVVVRDVAESTVARLRKYVLRSKVKIEVLASRDQPDPGGRTLLSEIRSGMPHVFPQTHEAFVAQMLNLDLLDGISFEKGCYTGQEIIARAHFRGTVKRRMFRFEAPCAAPAPGTRLLANNEHAGDVVYAADTDRGCELLAVVSLAHAGKPVTLDPSQEKLTRLSLPYSMPMTADKAE